MDDDRRGFCGMGIGLRGTDSEISCGDCLQWIGIAGIRHCVINIMSPQGSFGRAKCRRRRSIVCFTSDLGIAV